MGILKSRAAETEYYEEQMKMLFHAMLAKNSLLGRWTFTKTYHPRVYCNESITYNLQLHTKKHISLRSFRNMRHPSIHSIMFSWCKSRSFGGLHKGGYPNSWMVYMGKSHWNGWFGGTPLNRNPHLALPILDTLQTACLWARLCGMSITKSWSNEVPIPLLFQLISYILYPCMRYDPI